MKYEVYKEIEVTDDFDVFDFISTGRNGDRNKVLAAVASIVEAYTKRFPDRWIFFRGSTAERTRLYRIALGLHLDELSVLYDIQAYIDGEVVSFVKNLKINAFPIRRKKP